MKKWMLIVGSLVGLVAVAAAGYWGFRKYQVAKETSFACIATSFPYVIMEHKRSELTGLLDSIQIKDGEDPDTEALDQAILGNKEKPKIFFLSEDIDTKMLKLADDIQNKGPGSMDPETMTKALTELEPLFQKQASPYLVECKQLFGKIVDDCGDFDNRLEESHSCREKYDDKVTGLLKRHLTGL